MRKFFLLFPFALVGCLLSAVLSCHPVDRSGEQPFAPVVESVSATVEGDVCRMSGRIVSSINSPVTRRGFSYGNDTLRLEAESADATDLFHAETRPLESGRYYMVSFAGNGIGTTYGDTIYFSIGN